MSNISQQNSAIENEEFEKLVTKEKFDPVIGLSLKNKKKSKFKTVIKSMDVILLVLTILTCIFGFIILTSAVNSYQHNVKYIAIQVLAFLIGFFSIYIINALGYEHITDKRIFVMGACFFLLFIVLIPGIGTGFEEKGGRSWMRIGQFGFQPSEVVKIGFVVTVAKQLSMLENEINKFKNIIKVLFCGGLFIFLVILEPDAGTAMVYIFMLIVMIFFSGINYKYVYSALGMFLLFVPIAWFFILKDYQKFRIINFLNPENDPWASGYQVVQSKIAIGSGRIFGKGFLKGSSVQFGFLPEKHTDFIYSVIGEELGIIGSIGAIILISSIILRCIYIAKNSSDSLGMYISLGVASMLLFQTFENIGMCIGLMPVTGITLPFISYGGSSLLTNLSAIGLVLSVKQKFKK
ncbi:MAG: rod shape-determining protein RodA [Clostridiales bacterium]|nr:rod shape-determining protein RodA [Clostridiales bacterium]